MKLKFCRTMIRFRPDFPFCDWPKSTLPSLSPVPGEPFFRGGGSLHFGNFRWEACLEPSWIFDHRTSLSCCTTSTNFWVGSEHASSWGYNRNASLGTLLWFVHCQVCTAIFNHTFVHRRFQVEHIWQLPIMCWQLKIMEFARLLATAFLWEQRSYLHFCFFCSHACDLIFAPMKEIAARYLWASFGRSEWLHSLYVDQQVFLFTFLCINKYLKKRRMPWRMWSRSEQRQAWVQMKQTHIHAYTTFEYRWNRCRPFD